MRYSRILKGIVITGALVVFYALNLQAQTGPGGVGNADGSDGQPHLRFWLRADTLGLSDGESVTLWPDVSGNGNDFEQSVSSEQPSFVTTGIGNQPSVAYDGRGMSLVDEDGESYINGQSAFTLVSVIESNTTGTNAGIFDGEDPDGHDDVLTIRYDSDGSSGGGTDVIKAGITVGSETNMESPSGLQTTSPQMLTMQWSSGSEIELFVDGVSNTPTSASGDPSGTISDATRAVVGRGPMDASSSWDGRIAEVFLFSNKLNVARRTIVENYLSTKYGIGIDNDKMTGNDGAFVHDVAGIGKTSDGEQASTSSAGVYFSQNGGFDTGDYLMTANNNAANDLGAIRTGSVITNCGAEAAWGRDWYVEKTQNLDVQIGFNIPEAFKDGKYPQEASNYVLLYRSSAGSGDYSQVVTAAGISGSEEVYFNVPDADLQDGYYTLGTLDQSVSPVEGEAGRTWYTLVSGDWSDPSIWTLDPSGALPDNPNNETPNASTNDNVVILTGRTVTVGSDGLENANLTVQGRLDLQGTQNHSFATINGDGRILLSGDNFPAGDASHFTTEGQGEGTVEYYGGGFTLSQPQTFYNVEMDMTGSSESLVLTADYTLHGDLVLTRGDFQINDASNTNPLDLDVSGDVSVSSNASVSVGTADAYDDAANDGYGNYHKGFHEFRVGGSFTNNGTVRLTNLSAPDYDTRATNGAVSLVMYGAEDKKLTCNNTTDLYNLVVDKGSDRTYELQIYSDDQSYFALYGQNDDNWDDTDAAHPENRKALWIANGTLRLTGNIYIPSLTEGERDFTIGERAALVLDGPNVTVHNTAHSDYSDYSNLSHGTPDGVNDGGAQQAIYPYGKLQVNDGYYYLGNGEAINFRDQAPGVVEVNGGKLEANQIAISSSASSGTFVFTVTGGEVHVTNEYGSDGGRALLNLDNSDMVFNMSGGAIYVTGSNGHSPDAIHIASGTGNYNVSGGTVYIQSGTTSEVQSTAPFYNVEIVNGSTLSLMEPLKALGSLTIQNNATLTANDYDVSVGNNFDFKDGAAYNHGTNTTHFTGDQSSMLYVRNTTDPGDLTFNHLTLSKEQRYDPTLYHSINIYSGSTRSNSDHPLEIQGNLTIERGEFDVDEWQVDLKGDLEITEGNILYNASTPGRIVMNGASGAQSLKGSQSGNPQFGNLEFTNGNGVNLQSNIDADNIRLNDGPVNLDIYNLDISGDLTTTGTFGQNSLWFYTAGNASDGGLTRYIDLSEGTGGTTTLFPVGTGTGTTDYNPARVIQSESIADDGRITISPVNDYHPSNTKPDKTIPYYWVVDTTHFESVTTNQLKYTFTYSGTIDANENKGVVLWPGDYDWHEYKVKNGNDLEFPYETYLTSDFTLGNTSAFNKPEVYYSRIPTSDYDITSMPQWSDPDTWSPDSHTGASGNGNNAYPQDGDIAIIGYGGTAPGDGGGNRHHVAYRAGDNYDLAKVVINSSEDPDVYDSRLFIEEGATIDMSTLEGDGTLELLLDNNNPSTILGDFGDFTTNEAEGARVLYHGVNGDPIQTPDIFNQLPNVRIEGYAARTFTFPREYTIRGNLVVDHQATLRLEHDLTVNDDFQLGLYQYGKLEFPDDVVRTMTVDSNIVFEYAGSNEITIDNTTENGLEHRLRVAGDIHLNEGSGFDLFNNNTGGNNAILEIFGQQNAQLTDTIDMAVDLYRLEMNKQAGTDFSINSDPSDPNFSFSSFNINGPTDGDPKAIELNSGRLMLQDGGIDITLTSGGSDFYIPSEATLFAKHGATLRASGSNTGILLDGNIVASYNSIWDLDGGTNNYIEYTSSGNAVIDIYQADFYVGSQIRRNTETDGGILSFKQNRANSNVVIGTEADQGGESTRGIFELVNSGCYFEQAAGAQMTLANAVPNSSAPALNLQLDASEINLGEGSSIVFGASATAPGQNMGVSSNQPLKNLQVDNTSGSNPEVTMRTVSLTADTLTIDAGGQWDANGLNLDLNGDMIVNGMFTPHENTTIFSGSVDQQIYGSPAFHNLTKNTVNTLTLNADITVNNELRLESGTLADGGNTLNAKGDVWMKASHQHGASGDGIHFNGDQTQNLQGEGTFGQLTLNNASGIYVPEGNTITIDNTLKMVIGVFDIGKNLLVLDQDANIEEFNAFSYYNMVQTNISFTDAGIKKYFPEITSNTNFTYPLGSSGKYTPVEMSIDSKDAGGSIRVKAANEMHPGIIEDEEDPDPEITDADNVLQFHWVVDAESVSGFTGNMYMRYSDEDTSYTDPYNITDYITARLLSNSTEWNKYSNNSFDQSNNRLNFEFTESVNQSGISGDYTAGVDGTNFNGAIPDEVPVYHSAQDGDWFDNSTWQEDIPGGPKGAIAIVQDSVYLSSNYLVGYETRIKSNGLLDVGTTFGHRVGTVKGTGKLKMERGALPAGVYEDFFGDNGGTVEFTGNDNYDVLSEVTYVNNLRFSGTGERRLPNLDLQIYGNLEIHGGDVINEHDKTLMLDSNLVFTGGTLDAGTGTGAQLIFGGGLPQQVSGNFAGTNAWHHVEINNDSNVVVHDHLGLDGELTFTAGKILVDDGALVSVNNTSTSAINGYGAQMYVDGDLRKDMNTSDNFLFPVGDMGRYGKLELLSVSSSGFWQARYYNEDASTYGYDTSSRVSPLKKVSGNEFWKVKGPGASTQAVVKIRWDDESILPAETDDRVANLHIAEYLGGQWESKGEGSDNITDNGVNSGTIRTNSEVVLEEHVFTLASEESNPSATAAFVTQDTALCEGGEIKLVVELTGTSPWTIELGQPNSPDSTISSITTEKYTISIPNATSWNAGTYTILSVTDANGGGNIYGDPADVTVNNIPADHSMTAGSLDLCDGETTAIGLADSENGVEYELLLDGNLVQTATGDGSAFTFGQYGIGGLYEVRARNGGCELLLSDQINLAVHPIPDPQPLADPDTVCYDGGNQVTVLEANDVTGAGTSFSWTPTTDLDSPSNANTGYTPTTNPDQVSVTKTYDVEVESDYGCIGTGSIDIELYRRPVTGNQYHVPNNFDQN